MTNSSLPTLEHAGYLEPLQFLPAYVWGTDSHGQRAHPGFFACHFCGVGTHGVLPLEIPDTPVRQKAPLAGRFTDASQHTYTALVQGRHVQLLLSEPSVKKGSMLEGTLEINGLEQDLRLRAFDLLIGPDGQILAQRFLMQPTALDTNTQLFQHLLPTQGCSKLETALDEKPGLYPFHMRPSVLDITGRRVSLFYEEALERFADLILEHRPQRARTSVYASGRLDYFAVFAIQEVFRLLGVRNMTSNSELGYLSGALYQTFLGGQPVPFVSIEEAQQQAQGLYIFGGWNGSITHPPVFEGILAQQPLDAYVIDVMMTESAQRIAAQLGPERVVIIRSGGDSLLGMAIAHQLFTTHSAAISADFIQAFAEPETFAAFRDLALLADYAPRAIAERIAPEFAYRERIYQAICDIAAKLAGSQVPILIPSMGFSQTRGIVPHCIWANILAMVGKYGHHSDQRLAGGILQLPGQVNHETHIQSLSPQHFVGRIPVTEAGAAEAAQRMGLPADAYKKVLMVTPRLALDYSEPDSRQELYVFFGGQFATQMMNQARWIRKLTSNQTQFVVIDPCPDEFCLKYAALILPTPPHVASTKLYQNGEWRLSLSLPRRQPPSQSRSDATIVYDLMATIARLLREKHNLWLQHPDLALLISSGYMKDRFETAGLSRLQGEVSRPQLWGRIQSYLSGDLGNQRPLYCQPRRDGQPIDWEALLTEGNIRHAGLGQREKTLNYDSPTGIVHDLYGQAGRFTFFAPTLHDLDLTLGIVFCSGRSALSNEPQRQALAQNAVNSGKRLDPELLPDENPLYVSYMLAARYSLSSGDRVWVTNRETRHSVVLPVVPTSRLKGETVYLSIHKSWAEQDKQRYANLLTGHRNRCTYTGQTGHKLTRVELQKVDDFLSR